ncbi:DUF2793 domain-containing protein [Phyllobacterium meliloti]|uniref:DUF2793 domain-containing protein n=1 Tax=Phyllobacterium meliloti TaxID=555317 RepID=UPI001D157138|nr:DUF2793 domain-containing protein [Phyllobacterium sp. T1293]UGX84868.1 DUF2793 domain-containing protein [Phyllobacterium sp. T1293]
MEQTSNLKLPYIAPSQAQKHVTHNEAIRALDALVQLSVISRSLKEPPASAKEGERYIVSSGAIAGWNGKDGHIAAWQDGAWAFFQPVDGWHAWIAAENCLAVFSQGHWTDIKTGTNPVDHVGINTRADDTNRLSIKSPASLFDHAGEGHQLKINKVGDQKLASILFQSGYEGRAEIGTIWNRDFSIKVSADNKQWREVMIADGKTGMVQFPGGVVQARTGKKLSGLIFLPDSNIAILEPKAGTAVCASVSADLLSLKSQVASTLFASTMRGMAMVRIWNVSKSPAQSAWVKWDTGADQLQVSSADHIGQWVAGDNLQTADPVNQTIAVDISPLMYSQLGTIFAQDGVVLNGGAAGGMTLACSIASPVSSSNLICFKAEERRLFNVIGVYG